MRIVNLGKLEAERLIDILRDASQGDQSYYVELLREAFGEVELELQAAKEVMR